MTQENKSIRHGGASRCHLRVLETTDLHGHLTAYDYYHDHPSDAVGLVRTAALIRAARAEVPNCLLFDNGDLIEGNPLSDLAARAMQSDREARHPMIAAMNRLGYDAATLGNHDFNYGLKAALAIAHQAEFPVVLGNVTGAAGTPEPDKPLFDPYVILERQIMDETGQPHDLRIGVLGLTPPQILTWDRCNLDGRVETQGYVETTTRYVAEMRAAGADLVILLAHTGILPEGAEGAEENAGLVLSALPGVDVLLTGHTHMLFPSPSFPEAEGADAATGHLNGCPAVMAGALGANLGVIDLELVHEAAGWQVAASRSHLRPIATRSPNGLLTPTVKDDPEIAALALAPHHITLNEIRRPIGKSTTALHSYFAMATPSEYLTLLAEAQRAYVQTRLEQAGLEGPPVLGAVCPFKSGGHGGPDFFTDVPHGDLTVRSVADLYHYQNLLCALRISGAQLLEWLERSACAFQQILPGQTGRALCDPATPSYNFDVFPGLSYEFDLTQPARYDHHGTLVSDQNHRVSNLTFEGRPVAPEQEFIVATTRYRADGGGGFAMAMQGEMLLSSKCDARDILKRYVQDQRIISARRAPGWRFRADQGIEATLRTSPRARQHMQDLNHLRVKDLGDDAEGFCALRLSL